MPSFRMPKLGKISIGPSARAKTDTAPTSTASPRPTFAARQERKRSLVLASATLVCALGIGYVMQYGLPGMDNRDEARTRPMALTDITPTSSAAGDMPRREPETGVSARIAEGTHSAKAALQSTDAPAPITLAALEDVAPGAAPATPDMQSVPDPACDVTMSAEPAAGALVKLTLDAPCNASERLTLHHQGMMVTAATGKNGHLAITVPALAEKALFIASFASGDGATALAEVPTLSLYDRVALQWRGDTGLGLHAREFGADYFGPGHVHAGTARDLGATARGDGGFLVSLGDGTAPDALRAEIYTFPRGAAHRDGTVALSVEAEITAENCDHPIEAQTLEIRDSAALRTRDLLLDMPGCDAMGDFLVLNNLVEDLTIAAR